MQELQETRQQLATSAENHEPQSSVYLIPWLDQDYKQMHQGDERQRIAAQRSLMRKTTRLHITGALPAPTA